MNGWHYNFNSYQFITYPSFSTLRLFSPFIFDGSWGRGRAQFNGGISTNCCWMMRWQRNCGMRGNDRGREFCYSNQAALSFWRKVFKRDSGGKWNYAVLEMIFCLPWLGKRSNFTNMLQMHSNAWLNHQLRNFDEFRIYASNTGLAYVCCFFSHRQIDVFWAGGSICFARCCLVETCLACWRVKQLQQIQGLRLIEAYSIHSWVYFELFF